MNRLWLNVNDRERERARAVFTYATYERSERKMTFIEFAWQPGSQGKGRLSAHSMLLSVISVQCRRTREWRGAKETQPK